VTLLTWVYPDIPRYPSRIQVPTQATPTQMGTHPTPPPQIRIWVPDAQHCLFYYFLTCILHCNTNITFHALKFCLPNTSYVYLASLNDILTMISTISGIATLIFAISQYNEARRGRHQSRNSSSPHGNITL
jgi:hypothetical protein